MEVANLARHIKVVGGETNALAYADMVRVESYTNGEMHRVNNADKVFLLRQYIRCKDALNKEECNVRGDTRISKQEKKMRLAAIKELRSILLSIDWHSSL